MKKQLNGLIRLTRYREYPFFVIITSLLGVAAEHGGLSWKLIEVLIANLLAVAFAFMFNEVEDAHDDSFDPAKRKRNPVTSGDLSARTGQLASFGVALAAGLMYAFLGIRPLIAGLSCLVIAYLYSWQRVRFKSKPFADLISHSSLFHGW